MIKYKTFYDGHLSAMTELWSIAELTKIINFKEELSNIINFKEEFSELINFFKPDIDNPNYKGSFYYFNRIKVKKEGIGEGRELMKYIIKKCDEEKINIINELNPYGGRDLNSLKRFFRNSGFVEIKNKGPLMIRKFKNEY